MANDTIYCINCGTPNPAGNKFCISCGSKIEATGAPGEILPPPDITTPAQPSATVPPPAFSAGPQTVPPPTIPPAFPQVPPPPPQFGVPQYNAYQQTPSYSAPKPPSEIPWKWIAIGGGALLVVAIIVIIAIALSGGKGGSGSSNTALATACASNIGASYQGTIRANQTVDGNTYNSNGDAYAFSGRAGDVISVSMIGTGYSSDTYLVIYDQYCNEVTYDDDSGEGYSALINYAYLPSDGTYIIQARFFGGNTGTYRLTVNR
jgi:hypothetical protein